MGPHRDRGVATFGVQIATAEPSEVIAQQFEAPRRDAEGCDGTGRDP